MAEKSTFVKVDRNILQWRWYQDANTMRVFLHLLLTANITDHDFEKITIHRGEVATSISSLSRQLKISIRSVRTALEHLKTTGEVTCRIYPHYQVISILEYDRYQAVPTGRTTGKRQADDKQTAGKRQQSKNIRTPNGEEGKDIYSRPPSVAEIEQYAQGEGLALDAQSFWEYNTAKGWAGVKDWRPLVRMRARQLEGVQTENVNLDDFGRPIKGRE